MVAYTIFGPGDILTNELCALFKRLELGVERQIIWQRAPAQDHCPVLIIEATQRFIIIDRSFTQRIQRAQQFFSPQQPCAGSDDQILLKFQ